jgi:hypothetical protein
MDQLREFLTVVRREGTARGELLGLLHILIGRRLTTADGTEVSRGLSWRALAALLKQARWEPEDVRELNLDPDALPPRDRQRFWYSAIAQAGVHSPAAVASGDRLIAPLKALGYVVGPAPGAAGKPPSRRRR